MPVDKYRVNVMGNNSKKLEDSQNDARSDMQSENGNAYNSVANIAQKQNKRDRVFLIVFAILSGMAIPLLLVLIIAGDADFDETLIFIFCVITFIVCIKSFKKK